MKSCERHFTSNPSSWQYMWRKVRTFCYKYQAVAADRAVMVWLIKQGLTSHQTHYRSYRGRVFTSQMTQPGSQAMYGMCCTLMTLNEGESVCVCVTWHPGLLLITLLLSGVARICCEEGQSWKSGRGSPMADFRAGCSSCLMTNSFVTNAVLIKRAVSCWHLHQLISQTLNIWIVGCQVYSKVN